MTNTTSTKTTRRPTATSMKAALKRAGRVPTDDTPKALVVAFEQWVADGKPAATVKSRPATPAEVPDSKAPRPAPANCACGCGAPTITAKAAFLSGHDARHAGNVGRGLAELVKASPEYVALLATLPTPKLVAKAQGIEATARRRSASKSAAVAAKAAAKAAFDEAMAAA